MQPVTSKMQPPKRSRVWIPLVSLAAAVAVAVALLWLLRAPAKPATAARATVSARGTYRNRALFRPAGAAAEPTEKLAVRGNVYSGDGEVLVGATVIATTFDRAGNTPSPVGSARTDAKGQFAITVPEGTYQLAASMVGYGPSAATAESGDTVSLVLPKSGVIQGHVRDEHGQPIQHFTIDVVSVVPGDAPAPPPAWSKTFDSRDGSYRADQIPAWPVMIRAVADDRAPGLSTATSVHAGETRDVDLTLAEGCTLSGTVQDKHGEPLPGVLVNAEERATAGSATDPSLQTSTQAQTAGDGTFTLEHVPRGTVLLRGYDGSYAVSTTTVEVGDCEKLTKVSLTLSTGGSVIGVARRADGSPLANAHLSITDRSIGFVDTVSGSDGHFRFDAIPAGSVRLELAHEGQRALHFIGVKDGETTTQDMTLFGSGNGEISGRVTAGKQPIAGARLLIAANHGQQQGIALYFPVTGADGSYHVPTIPEGNYLISVMSTTEGRGVRVNGGELTKVDLDAGFVMPSGNDTPRPARQRAAPAAAPEPAPTPLP
jgi:Carboxypeptidase regulatory-like domain